MTNDTIRTSLLDSIESEAVLDMFDAAPASVAAELQMSSVRWPHGVGIALRSSPATFLNRYLPCRGAAAEASALSEATAWLGTNANRSHALDLPIETDHPLRVMAQIAGWRRAAEGVVQFGRGQEPLAKQPACELELMDVTMSLADVFAEIAQVGFEMPLSYRPLFRALVGRAGWRSFVACAEGRPVACGSMRVSGQTAWLGNGASLPEYRGRGAQSALLARRVADGLASGVRIFAVQTARPADGELPGPSYRNVLRAGFSLSHERAYFTHP